MAASAATITTKLRAQAAVSIMLTRLNLGPAATSGETCSRAYCKVNGWTITSDPATMASTPASTHSRTPTTDRENCGNPEAKARAPNRITEPTSNTCGDCGR